MKFIGKNIVKFPSTFDGELKFNDVSSGATTDDNLLIIKTTGVVVQRNISQLTAELSITGFTNDGTDINITNEGSGDIIFSATTDDADSTSVYMTIDQSESRIAFSRDSRHNDNITASFGDGDDLQIRHDGTDSIIDNLTGNFYIRNQANDKDIIFICDNGSGGTETYFRLDSSLSSGNPFTVFPDNSRLVFGNGSDLELFHNGSNSYIRSNTVFDMIIQQGGTDKDILFQADDGSGATTTYFQLDGSSNILVAYVHQYMLDNKRLYLGTGSDLELYHDGSRSYIRQQGTGDLNIEQTTDDSDIVFKCDDGSGGVTTYMQIDGSHSRVIFPNDIQATFGSSSRLSIKHDGTDATIMETQGDLKIINTANDKDIIFQSDNGSGGTTTYFRVDGSIVHTSFLKPTLHNDNVKASFGDAPDLHIYHDGTNSYIQNETGQLYILNKADDKDIEFQCDDGSGGLSTYFKLDGSLAAHDGSSSTALYTAFPDNSLVAFGDSQDLVMYHSGSHSFIRHLGTGNLYIDNTTDDSDILFRSDDGSGGLAEYFRIDGGDHSVKFIKEIKIASDSHKLTLGASRDLSLYHDGTDSYVENLVGDLIISNNADDKDIIFKTDNGSGGLATYMNINGEHQVISLSKNLQANDNVVIKCGTGGDLQLKHDGTDNFMFSNTASDFYIQQKGDDKDIIFQCDDGSGGITTYMTIDGGAAITTVSREMRFFDNVKLKLGSGPDSEFYHDGSNTYIVNDTGNLIIRNNVDDGDIRLQSDDGSGGIATYITLAGNSSRTLFSKEARFSDSVNLKLGDGGDLQIYHSGTKSFIQNDTGHLDIRNTATNSDIIFQADDGSGSFTEYFRVDGGIVGTVFSKDIFINDSVKLKLGTGSDFDMQHDGSNTTLRNLTGNLTIQNNADDSDIIFKSDDGSGGTTNYFKLSGANTNIEVSQNLYAKDDVKIAAGEGLDLRMYHESSSNDSFIRNSTGDLYIRNVADDKDIIFQSDDGSGGVETYFFLDGSASSGNPITQFPDLSQLVFGNSQDLLLRHDGTDSLIQNNGGDFIISQHTNDKDLIFKCDDGSGSTTEYFRLDGGSEKTFYSKPILLFDSVALQLGTGTDATLYHSGGEGTLQNFTGNFRIIQGADNSDIQFLCDDGSGGTTEYFRIDGGTETVEVAKPINLASASSSASSGIYAQFINLKGFCTLAANYKFAEDLEDTKSPFEMALDYGSATISSSTEVNQSNLFRSAGFHVPVACSVNAINMQVTCNNAGNVTVAVVEYRPSEAGTDQVDHPRTVYEEVVVASNDNNNKVKTVTVATADLDNTAIPAGSHIMIMAKGDSDSIGGSTFISAAIEIKW